MWEDLFPTIVSALPNVNVNDAFAKSAMQQAIVKGILTCWLATGDDDKVFAVMTTTVSLDFVTGGRNMLIYSITGLREISDEEYIDGIKTLKEHCLLSKCQQIIAYTKISKVAKIFKEMGGDAETVFLQMEV